MSVRRQPGEFLARSWLVACVALALSCAGPDTSLLPIPLASIETFALEVQPHLSQRCGSGGCHGRGDRPFSLFVPGAHRRDRERTYLDEPLTLEEIEDNARQLSAFALGTSAAASIAIRKPLAVETGGAWHGGGATFADLYDPACVSMSQWLDARPFIVDAGLP